MSKKLIIYFLEFSAGVFGNLIAGYIQQNVWGNIFTPERLFGSFAGVLLMFILISWISQETSEAKQIIKEDKPLNSKGKQVSEKSNEVNSETLRLLVNKIVIDDDFRPFCQDYFPEVKERLSSGMTRTQQIQILLEHCESRGETDKLLELLKQKSPQVYSQYVKDNSVKQSQDAGWIIILLVVGVSFYLWKNNVSLTELIQSNLFTQLQIIEITPIPVTDVTWKPSISAIVDPVIAWNGLKVKNYPNGGRIAGLPAGRLVTILPSLPISAEGFEWVEVQDSINETRGWVKSRYLLTGTVESTYIDLYWMPGCNPQRAEVQLLIAGQLPCDARSQTFSLDNFADKLRALGLLKKGEWLVSTAVGTRLNEAILIRTTTEPHIGWLKIGIAFPLGNKPSLVGGVWRTPYSSNQLATGTSVCWLRQDGEWRCETS